MPAKLRCDGKFMNSAERKVAHALRKRLPDEARILSNIYINNGHQTFEIDLVVITRHGVVAVDVKDWRGTWEVLDPWLWCRGQETRPDPRKKLAMHQSRLYSLLNGARHSNKRVCTYAMVLTFSIESIPPTIRKSTEGVPVRFWMDGVKLIERGDFNKLFQRFQDPLSNEEIESLSRALLAERSPCRTIQNYLLKSCISSELYTDFEEFLGEEIGHTGHEVRLKRCTIEAEDSDTLGREQAAAKRHFEAIRQLQKKRLQGVPLVYAAFEDPNDESQYWTVYEAVPGKPILEADLSNEKNLQVFLVVAQTLAQCHLSGISHRAMTPDCILVDPNNHHVVSILHFDYAKIRSRKTTIGEAIQDPLRARFERYCAPEVLNDASEANGYSDVYSLGKTIEDVWCASNGGELPPLLEDLVRTMTDQTTHRRGSMSRVVAKLKQILSTIR